MIGGAVDSGVADIIGETFNLAEEDFFSFF
jgi:hypothetical protein